MRDQMCFLFVFFSDVPAYWILQIIFYTLVQDENVSDITTDNVYLIMPHGKYYRG